VREREQNTKIKRERKIRDLERVNEKEKTKRGKKRRYQGTWRDTERREREREIERVPLLFYLT